MTAPAEPKICFVISPIGEEGSEVRLRADQVLRHVIEPVASACGYRAIRADKISEPGIITSQVIQHVVEDPLVIADLTGRNPNVFYELAIRHAVRKPVIQLMDSAETLPFDVAPIRTIQLNYRDLDSVEGARQELRRQIGAVEQNLGEVDTPFSVTVQLQSLRRSDNPQEQSAGEIMAMLQNLQAGLNQIHRLVLPKKPSFLSPSPRIEVRSAWTTALHDAGLDERVAVAMLKAEADRLAAPAEPPQS